jgi:hypothetical protein
MDTMATKEIEKAKKEIVTAYNGYKSDPFILPSHFRSLCTSQPLHQRLQMDTDSMHCWLHSFHEAKATQQETSHRYSESAAKFFQPKRKMPPSQSSNSSSRTSTYQLTQGSSPTKDNSSSSLTSSSPALSYNSSTSTSDVQSDGNGSTSILSLNSLGS